MSFSAIVFTILAGIVPSAIWLLFWLREDMEHPEPRKFLALAFFGGMVMVVAAVFIERYIIQMITDQSLRYISWAIAEELLKFVVFVVLIWPSKYFDEPIDAMIYLITIALGFAAVENALFAIEPFATNNITVGIATSSMRFVGATLVHVVCSAIIGFGIGYAYFRSLFTKGLLLVLGLLTASVLHSIFNLSIIKSTPAAIFGIFIWIWSAVVILLVMFEEIKAVKPKVKLDQ